MFEFIPATLKKTNGRERAEQHGPRSPVSMGRGESEWQRPTRDRAPVHTRSLDILDSHPDATFVIDRRRRVVAWNSAMEKLTGVRREDILGTADHSYAMAFYGRRRPMLVDLVWEQDSEIGAEYSQIERKGSVICTESCVPLLNRGEGGVICERVSPWTDTDGQILGAIESIQDLTEKKQREEEMLEGFHAKVEAHQEQLHAILSTLPDQVYLINSDLRFDYLNRIAARSLNQDADAIIGRTWRELGLPERCLQPLEEAVLLVFETGKPFIGELPHPVQQTEMEFILSPIYNAGGMVGFVLAAARDVTIQARSKEQLLSVAQELRRSNEELERFAYTVSHDLQEPLRTITSYTQLLARRYSGKLDPDADEFMGFVVEGASRMQALIRDLLLYSRVSSGEWTAEPVDMEAVLAEALDNLRTATEETSARITHDPLPRIRADAVQMVRLFQNLIGNGIKFHREGMKPEIHIMAERRGKEWIFSLRDNGIGIEPEFQGRIFEVFQRLHARNTYAGTGIGLPICRKIVDRHGGRIWVESEPGRGSTFRFSIPLNSADM